MAQYSSGLACRVFTSTDNCSMYAYRDNTVYDPTRPGTTGTRLGVKNQIKLEITPNSGSACAKPTTFEVANITTNDAEFTWENTGAASYTLEYKKASDSDWTVVSGIISNTHTLSTLVPGTNYNARVKAVCGTDLESGYSSKCPHQPKVTTTLINCNCLMSKTAT